MALACMCSSPIVVDARKRTKGERPEADASDVRLVQRQRGSVPHQPKPPVLPPFGMGACEPLGGAQGQQMWPPPQQQFPQQMQPHPNATIPPAQLGVVAAPVCGGMLSAISEPVVEVLEACGDALIEMQARTRPSCLHLPALFAPAATTRPLHRPRPSRPLHPLQPSHPPARQDTFIVARLLGKNAFGYEPSELEGKSILSILHPADHRPFVQTARALLAMAAGTPGVVTPPQSVRALHRVFFRRLGQTSEVMVDSIITAKRPDRRALPPPPRPPVCSPSRATHLATATVAPTPPPSRERERRVGSPDGPSVCVRMGAEAGLIMSSRCALPFPDDGGAAFRVFPVGGPNQGRQGR